MKRSTRHQPTAPFFVFVVEQKTTPFPCENLFTFIAKYRLYKKIILDPVEAESCRSTVILFSLFHYFFFPFMSWGL